MTGIVFATPESKQKGFPADQMVKNPSIGSVVPVTKDLEELNRFLDAHFSSLPSSITLHAPKALDRQVATKVLKSKAAEPISEQLFNSLANAKVMTSRVAMHLKAEWREKLFEQLDGLLDLEDWHEDENVLTQTSFGTFLRFITYVNPMRRPGLGLSQAGNLIAAWTNDSARLTLEFRALDTIRWVLSCKIDEDFERASGETSVTRLSEVLLPYAPDQWFNGVPD